MKIMRRYCCCSLMKLVVVGFSSLVVVIILGGGAVVVVSAENQRCPFDLLYHFGDGVFDSGNAIATLPYGPNLPSAELPYGQTYPGLPTGRWSDGMLEIDYEAQGLGFEEITAYLADNSSSSNAIMFAVATSPVLDRSFFTARRVRIPSYAAPLSVQISWFKQYLTSICKTPKDCANKLGDALVLLGDVEANDMTIPLIQGKSIQDVQSYIPYVTAAQISAARELIGMGAKRVIIPGNAPLGCYPSILTELSSTDSSDYDDYGCLKNINDLIVSKNAHLQKAINFLKQDFPNVFIQYADFYSSLLSLIRETIISAPTGNLTLLTCCGSGGKYNYDGQSLCGSPGVPVCSDPNQYIHWDGIHLTDQANYRLSSALRSATLDNLNCTSAFRISQPAFTSI